ncbi:hypothetical protein [Paenibacillus medicaginis]|uniref:Uncharacterized protein n=1 Tax=Paenibacillus medicaginis TaxID=1470560 RepID=A0ABV5C0J3_9BACL
MSYAYLDQSEYRVLHVVAAEGTASKHGKYVQTDIDTEGTGYPAVNGESIVYYSELDEAYIKGNRKDGKLIPTPRVIRDLADQLK